MAQRDNSPATAVTVTVTVTSGICSRFSRVMPVTVILTLLYASGTLSPVTLASCDSVTVVPVVDSSLLKNWHAVNSNNSSTPALRSHPLSYPRHSPTMAVRANPDSTVRELSLSTHPHEEHITNSGNHHSTPVTLTETQLPADIHRVGLMWAKNDTRVAGVPHKRARRLTRHTDTTGVVGNNSVTSPPLEQGIMNLLPILSQNVQRTCAPTLLTLFTVVTTPAHALPYHLRSEMLHNWAAFRPNISSVLFANPDDIIASEARHLNWTVLPLLLPEQLGATLPLKRMFARVQALFPASTFYGYVQGALFFGPDLVRTVMEVVQTLEDPKSCLIVGAKRPLFEPDRHRAALSDPVQVAAILDMIQRRRIDDDDNDSDEEGDADKVDVVDDTFVVAHHAFPWQHLPDVVIARTAYQNYLVALSLRYDFGVVDARRTLSALEPMFGEQKLVSIEPEAHFDPNLLAALDYADGYVTSAQFETSGGSGEGIYIWKREPEGQAPTLLSSRDEYDDI